MKLGISYNLFDGHELLKASIECVRPHADYISVVFQEISNFGYEASPDTFKVISDLQNAGLIDSIILYKPELQYPASTNELNKRNIGLEASREFDCTHHLSIDTDEFYYSEEFSNALFEIEAEGYDNTACQMQSYYKRPTLRVDPPEDYWVTFVTKIYEHSEFKFMGEFPVLVDPTRRMNEGNIYLASVFHSFPRSQLQMHHMSYVRSDLRSKLVNSSANHNFSKDIDRIVAHWEKFSDGDKALFAGAPPVYHDLVETSNDFSIDI